jgi:uncharacterized protein YbjT (DUF2867 family)
MQKIAIIGSNGRNGSAWIEAFLAAGYTVRNLVRGAAHRQARPNVDLVEFDLDRRTTYRVALESADLLALITPPDPRQVDRELGLIEAAAEAGVRRIINLSVIGADLPEPISAFARWQARVEAALRASPLAHVTLRPNGFMQNLLRQRAAILAGRYVEPTGQFASSLIDVRDVAAAAVAVAGGRHDSQTFDLTGPEALTGTQIAAILGEGNEAPVQFVSPPLASFRQALLEGGSPEWLVVALSELYEAIQDGRGTHLSRVNFNLRELIGRRPCTLREFVQLYLPAGPRTRPLS